MRRRYYNSKSQKKIRMEALLTMKKARREIDPVLLENAQKAIADAWFARRDAQDRETVTKAYQTEDSVPVDLKRNLCVIQKFIEMNADNKSLQRQIKSMISESL